MTKLNVDPSQNTQGVSTILNRTPLGFRRIMIVIIGFFIVAFDGADITAAALIYPSLMEEWGIGEAMISTIVTVSMVGMALGAFVAGPLADRWGRQRVILITLGLAAAFTLITAATFSPTTFIIARVPTMFFLGAAMPVTLAYIGAISPASRRTILVAVTFAGFTAGTAAKSYVGAWVIPAYGWHMLLVVLGVFGVLLFIMAFAFFDRSPDQLVDQGKPQEEIRATLKKLVPGAEVDHITFQNPPREVVDGGIKTVLSRDYIVSTISLWISYFIGLCVIYLFTNYFPMIVMTMGYTLSEAAVVTANFSWAGIAGAFAIGFLMKRFGRFAVLITTWSLAAITFIVFGRIEPGMGLLIVFNLLWGFTLQGTNTGLNALAATSYPSNATSTGVAWMHTFGRVGSILIGIVGGIFLTLGMSAGAIMTAMAVPLVIGVIALLTLGRSTAKREKQSAPPVNNETPSVKATI